MNFRQNWKFYVGKIDSPSVQWNFFILVVWDSNFAETENWIESLEIYGQYVGFSIGPNPFCQKLF